MKKALAFSLTACGQPKTEQPTDPAPSTSAPEPIATPEPIKDTAPEPEPEQTPAAPVETEDTQPPEETEPQEAEQVQLFTEVNETVYATGTVNIRASYTADSDKLGSLSAGESVTRTGIAIEGTEAEGWSRVVLFDGTTAYISNNYLSTTKPVAQQPSGGSTQGKPSGQTQQQQPTQQQTQQTQQPQQTQQTPQPSGGDSDAELAARKEAFINGMEQMFTEHGYNADGCDHEWTQEEKEALIKAVQIEGG